MRLLCAPSPLSPHFVTALFFYINIFNFCSSGERAPEPVIIERSTTKANEAPANLPPLPPIVGNPVPPRPPVAANANKRTVDDVAREEAEQAEHEEAQADLMDVDDNDGPPAPNEELSEDDEQGLEEGNPQKKVSQHAQKDVVVICGAVGH